MTQLLYQMHADEPQAFTDVIEGSNICTEFGCSANCTGFNATAGWDPVTGLGTPRYGAMMKYISSALDSTARRKIEAILSI